VVVTLTAYYCCYQSDKRFFSATKRFPRRLNVGM